MLEHWLRYLFPGLCLACDDALPPGRLLDLCSHCLATLPWNQHGCIRCALPGPAQAAGPCSRCLARPPPWQRAFAPLCYETPVSAWVRGLKDRMGMIEGHTLGLILADAAAAHYGDGPRPDLVVPVPLTPLRTLRRGHNQACILAAPLASRIGAMLDTRLVRRIGRSSSQRGQSRATRLASVRNAFVATGDLSGARVAMVDDVMTTGATLAALAETLLAAGASEVHAVAVARTASIRADR